MKYSPQKVGENFKQIRVFEYLTQDPARRISKTLHSNDYFVPPSQFQDQQYQEELQNEDEKFKAFDRERDRLGKILGRFNRGNMRLQNPRRNPVDEKQYSFSKVKSQIPNITDVFSPRKQLPLVSLNKGEVKSPLGKSTLLNSANRMSMPLLFIPQNMKNSIAQQNMYQQVKQKRSQSKLDFYSLGSSVEIPITSKDILSPKPRKKERQHSPITLTLKIDQINKINEGFQLRQSLKPNTELFHKKLSQERNFIKQREQYSLQPLSFDTNQLKAIDIKLQQMKNQFRAMKGDFAHSGKKHKSGKQY